MQCLSKKTRIDNASERLGALIRTNWKLITSVELISPLFLAGLPIIQISTYLIFNLQYVGLCKKAPTL